MRPRDALSRDLSGRGSRHGRSLSGHAARRGWFGPDFPYGTLAVNLVGCFAIGVVHQIGAATFVLSPDVRLFLATGVMGGLTTYSAFSYETIRLLEMGAWTAAALNVVVTTAGSLALCALGVVVGRLVTP